MGMLTFDSDQKFTDADGNKKRVYQEGEVFKDKPNIQVTVTREQQALSDAVPSQPEGEVRGPDGSTSLDHEEVDNAELEGGTITDDEIVETFVEVATEVLDDEDLENAEEVIDDFLDEPEDELPASKYFDIEEFMKTLDTTKAGIVRIVEAELGIALDRREKKGDLLEKARKAYIDIFGE